MIPPASQWKRSVAGGSRWGAKVSERERLLITADGGGSNSRACDSGKWSFRSWLMSWGYRSL